MVKGKSNFEFAAMRSGQSPEDLAIVEAEWLEWTDTDTSPMTFEPLRPMPDWMHDNGDGTVSGDF